MKEKTEFIDPEREERIVNLARINELISFYKIPLIFALLGIFLLGGMAIFWQSNKESAKVIFTQEASPSGGVSKIKADIEGAIANPGVYQLLSGSRIQDLLIAAGGLAASADRDWIDKNLNLAAKLTDGGKVYIPRIGEQVKNTASLPAGGSSIASNQININSASASELDVLPGIGPVTAQKIIDGRPYQTIEELISRKIVGKSVFEKIKDKISIY